MTKQTPAEIIAAWNGRKRCIGYPTCDGDLVATDHDSQCPMATPDEISLMSPYEVIERIAAALPAYLETVVQVAWRLLDDRCVVMGMSNRPTVAEVLAEADAKFREGT